MDELRTRLARSVFPYGLWFGTGDDDYGFGFALIFKAYGQFRRRSLVVAIEFPEWHRPLRSTLVVSARLYEKREKRDVTNRRRTKKTWAAEWKFPLKRFPEELSRKRLAKKGCTITGLPEAVAKLYAKLTERLRAIVVDVDRMHELTGYDN
jgi:hypothetical protein